MSHQLPSPHISVFLKEVTELLDIQPEDRILDGTLGFGGHSEALATKLGENGRLIGLDRDPDALAFSRERLAGYPQVAVVDSKFSEFPLALQKAGWTAVDKVLIDIGVSSWQIDQPVRGFSFQHDAPLDMRMDARDVTLSAADILNTYDLENLKRLFVEYGDIYNSDRLVENIGLARKIAPILTTMELKKLVQKSFYFKNQRQLMMKILAQAFQSLRIEVNHELDELQAFLGNIPQWLAPGGRIAVITFHSLEDRIVKSFFKERPEFGVVGKKVIQATYAQAGENPRSKSAKLRVRELKLPKEKMWKK